MSQKDLSLALNIDLATSGFGKLSEGITEIKKAGIEVSDLESNVGKLSHTFDDIANQQKLITHFKELETQLDAVNAELAETEAKNKKVAAGSGGNYTQQANRIAKLKEKQKALNAELSETTSALNKAGVASETTSALNKAGVAMDSLAAHEQKLNNQCIKVTRQLDKLNKEAEELKSIADAKITLGLDSDDKARKELDAVRHAYKKLEKSGKLSSKELARANQLHAEKVAELEKQLGAVKPTLSDVQNELGKFAGASAAFTLVAREAMQFQTAMAGVKKVVDGTPEQLDALGEKVKQLAYELGKTPEQIADIAAQGGQLGIALEKLPDFVKLAGKMSVAFDMIESDAAEATAKIVNVYDLSIEQMQLLGDNINTLGNNTAAKEKEIVAGMLRIGGTAKQFGLAAEQAAALTDALIALGKPPEVAATAINALLTKLQTAEAQGKKFQGGLDKIGTSANQLAADIQSNPQQALTGFLQKLQELDKQSRAIVLTEMFGAEYSDDLSLLVGGLDKYQQALDLVADKTANTGAMHKEFQAQMNTASAKTEQAKVAIGNLAKTLGESLLPIIGTAAEAIGGTANAINEFAESHPLVTQLATALATLKIGMLGVNSAGKLFAATAAMMSTHGGQLAVQLDATAQSTDKATKNLKKATAATRTYAAATGFLGKALGTLSKTPVLFGLTAITYAIDALTPKTEAWETALEDTTKALSDLQDKADRGIDINIGEYDGVLQQTAKSIADIEFEILKTQKAAKETSLADFAKDSIPFIDSNLEKLEELRGELSRLKDDEVYLKEQRQKAYDTAQLEKWRQEQAHIAQQAEDKLKGISAHSRKALDAIATVGRGTQDEVRAGLDTIKQSISSINDAGGLEAAKAQIQGLYDSAQITHSVKNELLKQANEQLTQLKANAAVIDTTQTQTTQRTYEQLKNLSQAWGVLGEDVKNAYGIMSEGDEKVLKALNQIVADSKTSAEEITKAFNAALSKVDSKAGVDAIQTTFHKLEKTGRYTADELKQAYDSIAGSITTAMSKVSESTAPAEEALKKLGLSTKQVQTGIRESAQETIDQFSVAAKSFGGDIKSMELIFNSAMQKMKSAEEITALKEQMQATGRAAGISSKEIERLAKIATDAANQATPEWQRLSKAISDATNAEQLRKFGEEARQAMSAGKISAEQYKDVLKQVENQQKQLNQAKQEQAEAERQAASAMQASTQAMAQNTQKTRENTEATKENAKTHLEALRRADETETQQLYDSRGLTEAQNERLKRRAEQINRAHAAFPEMGADYSELEKMADRFRRQNQREKTQTTQPQQVELVAQAFEDALAKQRLTQPALDTSTEKKIDKLSETFRKGLQEVEERGAQKGADMAVTKITRGLEQYRKGQGR